MIIHRILTFILLSLASYSAYSENINSITVFVNDNNSVVNDLDPKNNIRLVVYDLDLKDRATNKINTIVRARVGNRATKINVQELYQDEFSNLLNSSDWKPIYDMLGEGGKAIENTVRFGIKKLPAAVINDRVVIYGVKSLSEVMEIFNTGES